MRFINRSILYILLLISLGTYSTALAKSPADKITINGPDLAEPVEVTDPESLAEFIPWGDAFMDRARGALAEPPVVDQAYQIFFHLKGDDSQHRIIYTFHYYPSPSSEQGYIYFPGPDDGWYRVNIGTIMRGTEGKWYYASERWNATMQRVLQPYLLASTTASSRPDASSNLPGLGKSGEAEGAATTPLISAIQIDEQIIGLVAWVGVAIIAFAALWHLLRRRQTSA